MGAGRGHVATVKDLIRELESVGFQEVQGKRRHPKYKHPVTGLALVLPRGGGTNPDASGIFATKIRRIVKIYKDLGFGRD
jgi:predicted RNA binding protein YcfA (HicA-like mRNA interferase family)